MYEGKRLSVEAQARFGGGPKRYSEGPLYTPRQLTRVVNLLEQNGFEHRRDFGPAEGGMREYVRSLDNGTGDHVYINLDELGCNKWSSGTMIVNNAGEDLASTTIWDYLKENEPSMASRVATKLKRALNF